MGDMFRRFALQLVEPKNPRDTARPVLATIAHTSCLGPSTWFEVVYHDGDKWCAFASSNTFKDGEQVTRWKYADECGV
jgi:hypothetical protein